jgi:hypothetical protein
MASARRCVVLVPYLTYVEPRCEDGLRELERRGLEVRRFSATAAVDRTRSELATAALRDGFDELVWIDADIQFAADAVARLRDCDLPIVGGLCARQGTGDLAVELEPGAAAVSRGEARALVDVRYLGTGFLCTQRIVYEDIQRTFSLPPCNTRFGAAVVPYFLPMVIPAGASHWYLGEDYAFCERARQSGHRVVVDPAIQLGRIGRSVY